MNDKIEVLKNKIIHCDLAEEDKKALLEILSKKEIDLDSFLKRALVSFQLGSAIAKFFHIDIGDIFN